MKYLFNYIASASGGGLKRLIYFSRYFNKRNGADFIISSQLAFLKKKFKKNTYHIFDNNLFNRLFLDYFRLKKIYLTSGPFDISYFYGVPVYFKIAKKNYLHVSNILPFLPLDFYEFNFFTYLKNKYLKILLVYFSKNADIFFCESFYSKKLLSNYFKRNLLVFQNGDDEQLSILSKKKNNYINIATIVGTIWYKKINYSFKIFEFLLKKNPNLKLIIIGNPKNISKHIIDHKNVEIKGVLKHNQVLDFLKISKYFICSSLCENSFNSISEGVSLAETSIVSSIPSHIEFLRKFKKANLVLSTVPLKHFVIKNDYKVASKSLLKWDNLIKSKLI
jgi:hypothetical protein